MEKTTQKEKTPGFNCRIEVAFTADKNGQPIAYYLSLISSAWPCATRSLARSYPMRIQRRDSFRHEKNMEVA